MIWDCEGAMRRRGMEALARRMLCWGQAEVSLLRLADGISSAMRQQ